MAERHPSANGHQQVRRRYNPRIDYYPSKRALALMEEMRGDHYPLTTNSGVLDAIVEAWAELSGIKYRQISNPMTSGLTPELPDASARANDFGGGGAENRAKQAGGPCGARTRAGHPCRSKPEPGKRRCKWHGGRSTGPQTEAGRARSLANLRQYRRS